MLHTCIHQEKEDAQSYNLKTQNDVSHKQITSKINNFSQCSHKLVKLCYEVDPGLQIKNLLGLNPD